MKSKFFTYFEIWFVDLQKTPFFLGGGTIFPIFLTQKWVEKSWSNEPAPILKFGKSLSK